MTDVILVLNAGSSSLKFSIFAVDSLVAALGGIDALVFTAGIGEHAAAVRVRVCEQARWLGIRPDTAANLAGGPRISAPDSPVSAWVVPTNEELMIARHTLACARP